MTAKQQITVATVLAAAAAFAACGGSGSSPTSPTTPGNNRPVVTNITFPTTIPSAPGTRGDGVYNYADSDADVTHAYFRYVTSSTPFTDFDGPITPGRTSGQITFFIGCTATSQRNCAGSSTVALTLEDAKGNRSDPKMFTFTFAP